MLDWSDLRFFLAVAREQTLSGAARKLKVDQSTVGRRLTALESAMSARLFDRTPDGYLLTAGGEAVRAQVEQMEAAAIAVERKLVGRDARPEGPVRLATSDSFAAWFLVPRLERFRDQNAQIVVELVTGNRPVSLARREADLSLRLSKPTHPNLIARRLGRAAWALYAAESYVRKRGIPDLRRRLEGHDVVAFDEELAGTIGARWLASRGQRGRVALATDSLLLHANAVVAGLGLSPLPCVFGDQEPALRRLLPATIGHHDIWLVVHPDVRASARVRAVMEFLSALVAQEAPLLSGRRPRMGRSSYRAGISPL